MFIKSISIENYKCFDSTGTVYLTPGINLVLGKNNVGKTALLEAIGCNFEHKPFKDINSDRPSIPREAPYIDVELSIDSDELIDIALDSGTTVMNIFTPRDNDGNLEALFAKRVVRDREQNLACCFRRQANGEPSIKLETYAKLYGISLSRMDTPKAPQFRFIKNAEGNIEPKWDNSNGNNNNIFQLAAHKAKQSIYRFKAERLNLSKYPTEHGHVLHGDARNLAACIQQLTFQPSQEDRLCSLVQQIFPDIHRVVAKNPNGPECEIFVWPVSPDTEREKAVIPLSECGTGVAQVLAILYVIVTSKQSRIILIDEPNSFLHPGAAKKLIEILKKHPQHQYIISTHSPEIIKVANAENIILMTREQGVSKLQRIKPDNLEAMKGALIDLGSSLSDIFGADAVLWVEGKTEEECFRYIADSQEDFPINVSIVGVKHTGDFEKSAKNDSKAIYEIYNKLSGTEYLIPAAVGFIFDKENKTEKDMADLKRQSGGTVGFLPRRMYEKYLLDPEAIAYVLNDLPSFKGNHVKPDEVNAWMLAHGGSPPYVKKGETVSSLTDKEWLSKVDGAKLMEGIFSHFSGAKEEFRKTRDNLKLTRWLLAKRKHEAFIDIIQTMNGLIYAYNKKVSA